MKKARWMAAGILLLALVVCACAALGETGRIVTPKGPANMRKSPEDKAPLVESVPNKTLVEVKELGETWSLITYRKRTGYVKTEFLRAPSQLPGSEVYSDGGTVLIYAEADESAQLVGVLGCAEKVWVEAAEGDWLRISLNGEAGYVLSACFTFQNREPSGDMSWIPEEAAFVSDARISSAPDGEKLFAAASGDPCTVTAIEGDRCLVRTEAGYGWADVSVLRLDGAPDAWDSAEGLSPGDACRAAEEALRKKYKEFAKESLYSTCAVNDALVPDGTVYHIGFFNDQDQYLYAALVEPMEGRVVFAARYAGFASPDKYADWLLPEGETTLELSADTLGVGEVLDITARAWTANALRYDVYLDGQQMIKGENGDHFQASIRPRQPGEYEIILTAEDEKGLTASASASFTVTEDEAAENAEAEEVYSQRDGWWKDKKYRHSQLEKSGCAIFTLSHALHRLGITGEETEPAFLAVKYAQFLIPEEGTSNERLINKAANDYGFKSRTALYTDAKQIVSLFEGGAVFSFSPARGHIAMADAVSEDGKMVHVVDSAPGATFERIKNENVYYQLRSGAFRAALNIEDMPGAKWYLETDDYGAMDYWLTMDYVAKRGVRLIQPLPAEGEADP